MRSTSIQSTVPESGPSKQRVTSPLPPLLRVALLNRRSLAFHINVAFTKICLFSGMFTGLLINRYGPRPVALVGVSGCAIALFMTSFVPSINYIYLTYAIGLGKSY